VRGALSIPEKPSRAQKDDRHRAVGRLKIINVPVPAFDEADEWFD